jgi:methionyl-tRNA formyltransferase
LKIVFMGTGEIGVPTLRWLAGSGHQILGVYTQPDKPVGRRSVMTAPPIKIVAEELGIGVWQPVRLRNPEVVAELEALGADLIVVMAYGQILPKAILGAPRLACLNLHASILPKYRGAAPIQAVILAGDRESGITVMHMAEGLDTGDVLLIESLDLAPEETGGSLHDRLAELGPVALEKAVVALSSPGVDEEEIRQWVAERLADYKVPRIVQFVDELPKNATGKILKRELRGPESG